MTIKTEEEAAKTWCPESRKYSATGAAYNRIGINSDSATSCIGSKCAAWRWWEYPPSCQFSKTPVDGWIHTPAHISEDKVEYWEEPYPLAQKRRRGYCGKAGEVRIP